MAHLQSEFCTKVFFSSSYEFSHERCSENFPEFFEPLFCGSEKIPTKFPPNFPLNFPAKNRKKSPTSFCRSAWRRFWRMHTLVLGFCDSFSFFVPNAVALNAVGRRSTRIPQKSAKERKRAQRGANERKRALPRKNCKQPGLKQPGLGTPDSFFGTLVPVLGSWFLFLGSRNIRHNQPLETTLSCEPPMSVAQVCLSVVGASCESEKLEKAVTVDFKKNTPQGGRWRQGPGRCRPKLPGRFAFPMPQILLVSTSAQGPTQREPIQKRTQGEFWQWLLQ